MLHQVVSTPDLVECELLFFVLFFFIINQIVVFDFFYVILLKTMEPIRKLAVGSEMVDFSSVA